MKTKNKKIDKNQLNYLLHRISSTIEDIRFACNWDNKIDENTKHYIEILLQNFTNLNEFINNAPDENN